MTLLHLNTIGSGQIYLNPRWIEAIKGDNEGMTVIYIRGQATFQGSYRTEEPLEKLTARLSALG